jgi:hypothetical protein
MGSYKLPFPEGKSYRVSQGNNEQTSHHGKARFAFDFAMPEGDLIVAARGGVVSRVQERYTACGGSELANKTNFVIIEHYDDPQPCSDLYLHIFPHSAAEFGIKPGDTVQQGQSIARAGKVGWSWCGAHLHFQRQERGRSWWQQSLPSSFVDVPGGVPVTGQVVTSQNIAPAPPSEPPAPPETLLDGLRLATFREVGSIYRPSDPFIVYAASHALGAPLGHYFRTTIMDQNYLLQVFARDTLYVPLIGPAAYPDWLQKGRMSDRLVADRQDPLGMELLKETYKAAGHTFHPDWAMHQYYVEQMGVRPLGAPLGPPQRLEVSGGYYVVELYALDTLYTPIAVPEHKTDWGVVKRMSDLMAELAQEGPSGIPGGQ